MIVAPLDELWREDVDTGLLTWRFKADSDLALGPLVGEGLVYAVSTAGTLYALDAATGVPRWQLPVGGQVWQSEGWHTMTGLAIAGTTIAVPVDHRLVVLRPP